MKAWKKVLHKGDEAPTWKKARKRSFIMVMKDQRGKKKEENPLLKALLLIYSYVLGREDFRYVL